MNMGLFVCCCCCCWAPTTKINIEKSHRERERESKWNSFMNFRMVYPICCSKGFLYMLFVCKPYRIYTFASSVMTKQCKILINDLPTICVRWNNSHLTCNIVITNEVDHINRNDHRRNGEYINEIQLFFGVFSPVLSSFIIIIIHWNFPSPANSVRRLVVVVLALKHGNEERNGKGSERSKLV